MGAMSRRSYMRGVPQNAALGELNWCLQTTKSRQCWKPGSQGSSRARVKKKGEFKGQDGAAARGQVERC